jgi:hypothetical protein
MKSRVWISHARKIPENPSKPFSRQNPSGFSASLLFQAQIK